MTIKTFVDSLTPAELTIIVAFIGAVPAIIAIVVSILTTRYIVKHGPNYSEKIDRIDETLAVLAETQESFTQQQAQFAEDEKQRHLVQERRLEEARWKPSARIESPIDGLQHMNKLILKSPDQFRLLEVSLHASSGAKLVDYPRKDDWVSSTGFGFLIPHDSLNKAAETCPSFFQRETFEGIIRFKVQRDGKEPITYVGEVHFHGQRAYVQNNCSFKITG